MESDKKEGPTARTVRAFSMTFTPTSVPLRYHRCDAMPEKWDSVAAVDGKVELSATQVRAAEILLKKTLPDLGHRTVGRKLR